MPRLTRWLPAGPPVASRRFRPTLETLDRRDVPALLFVESAGIAADATHFHSLSAAVGAAQAGDTIQIEYGSTPGSADGTGGTNAVAKALTIQGTPLAGPSALPQVASLAGLGRRRRARQPEPRQPGRHRAGAAAHELARPRHRHRCGRSRHGPRPERRHVPRGRDAGTAGPVNGCATDNVFTSVSGTALTVARSSQFLIEGNVFASSGPGNATAIAVANSTNVTIRDNSIAYTGTVLGIAVDQTADTSVAILDNLVDAAGATVAVTRNGPNSLGLKVEGNDLLSGTMTVRGLTPAGLLPPAAIDLGNGAFGSLGGNLFTEQVIGPASGPPGTSNPQNIALLPALIVVNGNGPSPSVTVPAQFNEFIAIGLTPGTYPIDATNATVDTANTLSSDQAYVASLYTRFLKRAGTAGEVNGWVAVLNGSADRFQVAEAITVSLEAHTVLAGSLYHAVLGRAMVGGEGNFWIDKLNNAATEEEVAAGMLASPEYAARAARLTATPGIDPNVNFVQSLYATLLGRAGTAGEVDYWLARLAYQDRGEMALGFLASAEFRGDMVQALTAASPAVRAAIPLAGLLPDFRPAVSPADLAQWVASGHGGLIAFEVSLAAAPFGPTGH